MASGKASGSSGNTASAGGHFMDDWASSILDDVLESVMHDIIIDVHREHKILRAQSAALLALNAHAATQGPLASPTETKTSGTEKSTRFDTSSAYIEDDKVYLKGNPLVTTQEILCTNCRLPRYIPSPGESNQPPAGKQFCSRLVWCTKPGHDIFGQPIYGQSNGKKSKKDKETAKTADAPTPGSFDSANPGSPSSSAPTNETIEKGKKDRGPMVTCPNCSRNIASSRFAPHLEKCLGIAGRKSARTATAKITQEAASGRGTPAATSRAGTPVPNSSPKRAASSMYVHSDDEDEEKPPAKRSKLGQKPMPKNVLKIPPKIPAPKSASSKPKLPKKLSTPKKKSSNLSEAVITMEDDASMEEDTPPPPRMGQRKLEAAA